MNRLTGLMAAMAVLTVGPVWAAPDPLQAGAEAARDRALTDPTAYDVVESLSTEVGPRLAGSEAAAWARDWGVAKLKALGFSNVHVEPFPITGWARGPESAEVISPFPQRLAVIGLGGGVSTPPEGIEGEMAIFHSYADLLAAPVGSLAGKIAVVTEAMPRSNAGAGYGQLNPNRRAGPSEAARRGAIGYLVRSLDTGVDREPHTGALNYKADAPKIPAAALSVIDAQLLDRMATRGVPVRIRMRTTGTSFPATGWTVVGDIPGVKHPDQVIIVGGHLDSWDAGTGSIDDGTGIAITVAAIKMAAAGHPPERTLRAVMFGAEEMDFTDKAFTAAHLAEAGKIVVIGESDSGADNILSMQLPAGGTALPQMQGLSPALAPLNVPVSPQASLRGGSDITGLAQAGVPVVSFRQDASRYFDWHHSAEDTLDKVDRAQLNQNVAAWAAFLYMTANSDVDFRAGMAAAAPKP